MVRCKFKCISKTQRESGNEICFQPVTHGSPENDTFFKWTPWGELKFGTINDVAAEQFKVGKEYYIDFTPCED